MKKLLAALIVGAFAFASVSAFADDKSPATPVDQAKLKAERDAAKAKWDKMTPEEKAATRKGMQSKRLSELNAVEKVAQEGSDAPMSTSPADAAKLKADRDAAKAKWDKMTPEEKAATRKAAQSKKLSELTEIEKMSQQGQ
jgi:hypothetical protein